MSAHSDDRSKDPGHGLGEGMSHGMTHVMPIPILLGTFAVLLFFTFLTIYLARFEWGEADLWLAMTIATIKAGFVATFFMHLRYDKPLNLLIFVFCLFFVALFLGTTSLDSFEYQPAIEEYQNVEANKRATGG